MTREVDWRVVSRELGSGMRHEDGRELVGYGSPSERDRRNGNFDTASVGRGDEAYTSFLCSGMPT